MRQKILIPLLLIIIACSALYFLFTTNTSPSQELPQMESTSIEYKNTEYSFTVTLPLSWKGYSIVTDVWNAYSIDNPQSGTSTETGPLLSIRNPLWSTSTPRQDIPILVLTLAQWDLLMENKIHIGASPINPSELGRNEKYIFALPARYNYAFPLGYEEVESILQTKPLRGY